MLSEIAAPLASAEPRALIKRRARRLINTAFIALTAEPSLAEPALAATRHTLGQFAAAPSWKERPVIRSFLDCAEIAVAVALAHDWLFDTLTECERREIEASIRRNVLLPALDAYRDQSLLWPRRRDNCTLVSNAGIIVAALSMLPCDRSLAAELLRHGLISSWNIFSAFAPDGAWREGLSYWSLAMRYAGFMVAALESTLGCSFGLSDCAGFAQTGDFALHAAGPFGAAFNFGDSQQQYDILPLAWFAHRFGRPVDGWLLGESEGWYLPFTAIWPCHEKASPTALGLPTAKVFRSADLACFRNTWSSDPAARAVYLAIKGGNVSANRSKARFRLPKKSLCMLKRMPELSSSMAPGTAGWSIWARMITICPGISITARMGAPGRRWRYYRSRAAGHNTLTIVGHDQLPNSPATVIGSNVEGENKWVVLDLSPAYGQPAGTIRRGAALLGRQIVIQDEIDPGICSEITWTAHTAAEPAAVTGSFARFRIGDDQFDARILEPAGARFALSWPPPPRSFSPDDPRQLHGRKAGDSRPVSELPRCTDAGDQRAAGAPIRRLQIILPAGTPRVTVLLLPDCEGNELALPITPLDHWLARRPVRLAGVPRRGCRARGLRTALRCRPKVHEMKNAI